MTHSRNVLFALSFILGLMGCKGSTGTAGLQGSPGPTGATGATGPVGPAGPSGSPDTGEQILGKLVALGPQPLTGLNAEKVGGMRASELTVSAGPGLTLTNQVLGYDPAVLQQRVSGTCVPGSTVSAIAADGTVVCAKPFVRTRVVSPVGNPTENGAALVAAVDGITDATSTSPWLVRVEPGTFDLAGHTLAVPSDVTIEGAGQFATTLTSSVALSTALSLAGNNELRDLSFSFDNAAGPGNSFVIHANGYATLRHLEVVSGAYTVGVTSQGSTVVLIDSFISSTSSTGIALMTTTGVMKVYNSRVAGHVSSGSPFTINFGGSQVDVTPDGYLPTCAASFHANFAAANATCG